MEKFRIYNKQSGVVLGIFTGQSEKEALDKMAKDAGYKGYASIPVEIGGGYNPFYKEDLVVELITKEGK